MSLYPEEVKIFYAADDCMIENNRCIKLGLVGVHWIMVAGTPGDLSIKIIRMSLSSLLHYKYSSLDCEILPTLNTQTLRGPLFFRYASRYPVNGACRGR